MNKGRLEAFSDGLFAVVITIMVLELNAPSGVSLRALMPQLPIFLSYVLSFVYGTVFWINHHYLLAATRRIDSVVLWANMNFLFWLSLIPFFTSWVDDNHAAPLPVAAYGAALFMVFLSYRILELMLFRLHDTDTPLVRALRSGRREWLTIGTLGFATLMSFVHPYVAMAIYIVVAAVWVVPPRALKKALEHLDTD